MNTLRHACELNNSGSSMLLSGMIVEGINAYRDSLLGMEQSASVLQGFPDHLKAPCALPDYDHDSSQLFPLRASNSKTYKDDRQDAMFVYQHPFFVEPSDDPTSVISSLSLYTATVLFNLGLACHKQAQQGHERQYMKASRLYQMSLELIYPETILYGPPAACVLAVLALNNKANCHYELNQNVLYHNDISHMANTLMVCRDKLNDHLEPSVVNALALNSIVVLCSPPTTAKAA